MTRDLAAWLIAIAAGCAGRGIVAEENVESEGGGDTTTGGGEDTGRVSAGCLLSCSTDGPELPGSTDETGPPIECAAPETSAIALDLIVVDDAQPGPDGSVWHEFDCEIQTAGVDDPGLTIGMDCDVAPSGYVGATLLVTLVAEGITVPADLVYPAQVHARVSTYVESEIIDEFPWRRFDHVALYRDDELVLGVAAGGSWPSTAQGEPDVEFWAPFVVETLPTDCPGEPRDCHRPLQAALGIAVGDEVATVLPYSVASIGGYDVHVGEMIGTDSPMCGEPTYNWVSFAIAPVP